MKEQFNNLFKSPERFEKVKFDVIPKEINKVLKLRRVIWTEIWLCFSMDNTIVLIFLKSSLIIIYLLKNLFDFLKFYEIIWNLNIDVGLFANRSECTKKYFYIQYMRVAVILSMSELFPSPVWKLIKVLKKKFQWNLNAIGPN